MFAQLFWSNPLIVKHARSRLRRQQFFAAAAVVVVICACMAWAIYSTTRWMEYAGKTHDMQQLILIAMLILQTVLLHIVGAAQVATAVAQARESGMLDFHRVSPQSPLALAVGFLFGAPIREYLLYVLTLPFFFYIVTVCRQPVEDLDPVLGNIFPVMLDMLVLALLYYTLALLIGLSTRNQQQRSAGALAAVIIIAINLLFFIAPSGFLSAVPLAFQALGESLPSEMPISFTFFGQELSPFTLCLLHQAPLFIFLFTACERKMRGERTYAFSRPVALLFYVVIAFLTLGDSLRDKYPMQATVLTVLFVLLFAGLVLIALVTPDAGDFAKGARHARKLGQRHTPLWHDTAANAAPALVMALILLASVMLAGWMSWREQGMTTIDSMLTRPLWMQHVASSVTIAIGAFLFFSLGLQAFNLRFRKHSQTFFSLLLFLTWIVPLLIGTVITATSTSGYSDGPPLIFSASPFVGMVVSIVAAGDPSLFPGMVLSMITTLALACAAIRFYISSTRRAIADLPERKAVPQPHDVTPPALPVG